MDSRLDYAGRSLGSFLEDEMLPEQLGFPTRAQAHLDHFRSFLHSFYVQKHGYWPPAPLTNYNKTFSKSTYRAMYFDFRSLYQYLLDGSSDASSLDSQLIVNGLNIQTAINSLDSKYNYQTLPHPLPLLPCNLESSPVKRTSGPLRSISSLFFKTREEKAEEKNRSDCILGKSSKPEDCWSIQSAPSPRVH